MRVFIFSIFWIIILSVTVVAQGVPTDPNHLPQQMGGNNTGKGVELVTVTGRIVLEGIPPAQVRPIIYIVVYHNNRFNQRQQVSENGSYILNNVPQYNSTLAVEIEKNEVTQQLLAPSTSSTISQDFYVTWLQVQNSVSKPGTISAKDLYARNDENQKLFEQAVTALREKKNEAALNFFKQIVKNDTKDFIAWTQLGNLYFLNEKFKEAEEAYTKALEQKPDYMLALMNLGKVQIANNETEKSIVTLTKVVESEPKSADAQHFLGEAYLQAKKGSKAVVYLNEAIRLAPIEKAEIHLRLATLYNGANLKDRAAAEYKQFLAKVPNYKEKEKLEKYIKENLPKQ